MSLKKLKLSSVIFGQNVYRLRQKSGMTQKELAERAGIHCSSVQKIEAGEANPKIGVVMKIEGVFRCGWEELLD